MFKYRFCISTVMVAAMSLTSLPANAQSACGERKKFVDVLARNYQEVPSAFGIAGERNLVELFISKQGTWTLLVTQPSGMSCIMAAGQSWEQFGSSGAMTAL
jgi:hypothetical protein